MVNFLQGAHDNKTFLEDTQHYLGRTYIRFWTQKKTPHINGLMYLTYCSPALSHRYIALTAKLRGVYCDYFVKKLM